MQANTQSVHAQRRHELAAFLQACRKRLTPEHVGLPPGERRRVQGLRREEVATLAGIGITWYTWLEQGRAIQVSKPMLERLAQVLHLSEAERVYLFTLAGTRTTPPALLLKSTNFDVGVRDLQPLLDALEPQPALLRNQYWDILAWNEAETSINPWPAIPVEERNMLLYLFTHPHPRIVFPHWEDYAHNTLQVFRLASGPFLQEPRFAALIHALLERSSEFKQWWQEYTVEQQPPSELEWRQPDGRLRHYSMVYATFPLHASICMRLLLPQGHTTEIGTVETQG